jgi:dTDP-glucose 4,6-dehydratase
MRNPQNILVTGGAGFIGSAFVRFVLAQPEFSGRIVNLDALTYAGNTDNLLNMPNSMRHKLVVGDIRDMGMVAGMCDVEDIDTIVHFAAESHVDRSIASPLSFVETNVMGTACLLEVVRSRPRIHFHHVSTDEVYGSLGHSGYFTEVTPYSPNSPYSASKAASDHLVRAYEHTYGISTTMSNCSNNYGPRQFPEKFVPLMILNMIERKQLPVYGDGSNVRDWLHVDDHARALWEILRRGRRGETYNIGGGEERSNSEMLEALIDVFSSSTGIHTSELRDLIVHVKDRPGHDKRYAIDSTKIEREIGFRPTRELHEGLRETVQWYLSNKKWVSRVRSGTYRK